MTRIIGFLVLFVVLIAGCSDDSTGPANGKGEMKIYMVDSPSIYDSVVVCISEVEVHTSGSAEGEGWIVLNDSTRYFDLLQLSNGANVLLGDAQLEAGNYTQIRLIVTGESYVIFHGIKTKMTIAGGIQTGIKLNHQFTIEAGVTYNLFLDFNAESSVHFQGNGSCSLTPVIRIVPGETSGSISGKVLPLEASAKIWTLAGSDTASTFPDESGYFKLMALPEGKYDVNFTVGDTTYADTTVTGVDVMAGSNTSMGTITLKEK